MTQLFYRLHLFFCPKHPCSGLRTKGCVFHICDACCRSGNVTTLDQLTVIMRSLGMSPTIMELKAYMKEKMGRIAFADFLDIMHTHRLVTSWILCTHTQVGHFLDIMHTHTGWSLPEYHAHTQVSHFLDIMHTHRLVTSYISCTHTGWSLHGYHAQSQVGHWHQLVVGASVIFIYYTRHHFYILFENAQRQYHNCHHY